MNHSELKNKMRNNGENGNWLANVKLFENINMNDNILISLSCVAHIAAGLGDGEIHLEKNNARKEILNY